MTYFEPLDCRMLFSRIALDPTWGNSTTQDGVLTIPGIQTVYGAQVEALPAGKLQITGLVPTLVDDVRSYNFTAIRLGADGTIESTKTQNVGQPLDDIFSAFTQSDGKILFAGSVLEATDMSVLRLNADGTVDTSFGTNGIATFFKHSSIDDGIVEQASTMAVQPDGKILVVGDATDVLHGSSTSSDTRHAQIARLTADGHLDTTFSGDGTFTLDSLWSELRGVVVLPSGKILATGNGPGEQDGLLLRFNSNGTLDTSFDGDGMLLVPGVRQFSSPAPMPDGKWIVGGEGLVRLNADGTLDTTFGTAGVVKGPSANLEFDSPTIDAAGRIVSVWFNLGGGHSGLDRYLPDGTPDTTFADGGFLVQDFISGPVIFQGDDDHLIVGGSSSFELQRFAPVQSVQLSSHGILYVTATAQDDDVLVERTASNDRLLVNGTETLFAKNAVKGVNLYLDAGDDAARVLIDVPATVNGGNGDDLIETANGDDAIDAGHGDDTIRSGDGADTIDAGDGNNRVFSGNNASGGAANISAGAGDDVISAGDGTRGLFDSGGNNRVTFGNLTGYCDLVAGDGNDSFTIVSLGDGQMSLSTGGGDDTILSGGGSETRFPITDDLGDTTDVLRADTIHGGAGNDVIHGGTGRQIIYGDEGNDSLYGAAGSDYLIGGKGSDLLSGGGSRDYLIGSDGADRLYGGSGNDRLHGDAGADRLFGAAGDDELFGGGGNDNLDGGAGNDLLQGGAGDDLLSAKDGETDQLFGDGGHDSATADANDLLTSIEALG